VRVTVCSVCVCVCDVCVCVSAVYLCMCMCVQQWQVRRFDNIDPSITRSVKVVCGLDSSGTLLYEVVN
jgi:hypothetical protein